MVTPPPIEIANISMGDTIILMVLALVVFGPRRLPQIGRQIGKLMYEFRKASNDFKFQMEEELRQAEESDRRKKEEAEREKSLAANPPAPQLDAPAPHFDPPAESAAESAPATPESPPATPESTSGSPYPGETTEPKRPRESVEDLTASAPDAARPHIQPPSTGEVVAASPPGKAATPAESPVPAATTDNVSGANEAANEAERSEPATHHG